MSPYKLVRCAVTIIFLLTYCGTVLLSQGFITPPARASHGHSHQLTYISHLANMDPVQEHSAGVVPQTNQQHTTDEQGRLITSSDNNQKYDENIQDCLIAESFLTHESLISDGQRGENLKYNKENISENFKDTNYLDPFKEEKTNDVKVTRDYQDSAANDNTSSQIETTNSGHEGSIISEEAKCADDTSRHHRNIIPVEAKCTEDTLSETSNIKVLSNEITEHVVPFPKNDENMSRAIYKTEEVNKVHETQTGSVKQECQFLGQSVENSAKKDITSETDNGKPDTKIASATIPAYTVDPFTYLDQPTILMSRINVLSPKIDTTRPTITVSTDNGKRYYKSGGIRNMFPSAGTDRAPASNERSNIIKDDTKDEENEKEGSTKVEGDVVLVTGGSGFLGQHIVKLLHQRAPHVAEIRVLDLVYFEKKLDYESTKRMKSMMGDISNAEFVNKALKGVNSVYHVAGVVSWGTFPDYQGMEKVNVKGTLNILNACLKNNVERLVYCSTVDVVVGNKPIRGGTEEDTSVPDKFLFPGYPETKYHGERIIMGAGPHKRHDGGTLQTVILRTNVLYGELDKYYITNALRLAKQSMGIVYRIGDGTAMFQQAYVGNAAWAFICADTAMKVNPGLTREVFYIPDNTPIQNSFNFLIPYLDAHGFKLSDGYLSYAFSHSAVAAAEILAKAVSPLVKINLPVQSCTIAYINTDLYFRGEKAKKILGYESIFTANEARDMSMKFYGSLDLEDKPRGWNREAK